MSSLAALKKFSLHHAIDYSDTGGEVEDATL